MRLRPTGQPAESRPEGPNAPQGELSAILERQRAELESAVAEAEKRVVEARAQADQRIEQQRRESETLVEQERHAAEARITDAEQRLARAEERAVAAEGRATATQEELKGKSLKRRAARKLAEAERVLEEERAQAQLLRERGERLESDLKTAQELRQTHTGERATLERRVVKVEADTHDLQATLERERGEATARIAELEHRVEEAGTEHEREHNYRRQLEERIVTELASSEELRSSLERQTAAATTQAQRLEQVENELQEVREEAAAQRAERQRVEQRLHTLLQSETDARTAREQQLSELEHARAEAVARAEAAERRLGQENDGLERAPLMPAGPPSPQAADLAVEPSADSGATEPGPQDAPAPDFPTPEPSRNGSPPAAPAGSGSTEPIGRRGRFGRRWRRRAPLRCAVCHRARPAMNDADLTAEGWTLTAAGALCPACQEDGWQFPAEVAMPFRRVDARSSD